MLGTSRAVATVLSVALLAGQIGLVAAQPQPTPQQKQQVQDLVKQAIAKSQAGDHAAAIELYQKAYATSPLPTLLSNIGAEYQLATKPVEALKYFCMYLDKDPAGPLASYATGQAKQLQSQLTGTTVEEADVCKAPAPQPPPPPPPTEQPLPPAPAPEHGDPGKGMKTGGLIVGGVGVVSLGLGVYFGLQAQKHTDYINNNTDQWRTDITDYQDEGQRDEYLQITFLAVGGVAVAAGTYLFLKGRSKSRSAESTIVAPTASPGGAGVLVRGSF